MVNLVMETEGNALRCYFVKLLMAIYYSCDVFRCYMSLYIEVLISDMGRHFFRLENYKILTR